MPDNSNLSLIPLGDSMAALVWGMSNHRTVFPTIIPEPEAVAPTEAVEPTIETIPEPEAVAPTEAVEPTIEIIPEPEAVAPTEAVEPTIETIPEPEAVAPTEAVEPTIEIIPEPEAVAPTEAVEPTIVPSPTPAPIPVPIPVPMPKAASVVPKPVLLEPELPAPVIPAPARVQAPMSEAALGISEPLMDTGAGVRDRGAEVPLPPSFSTTATFTPMGPDLDDSESGSQPGSALPGDDAPIDLSSFDPSKYFTSHLERTGRSEEVSSFARDSEAHAREAEKDPNVDPSNDAPRPERDSRAVLQMLRELATLRNSPPLA
jgi:hypothetical protein